MPDFFSPLFFSLKAKPKILLGVAKPSRMVLPLLAGLFLKKGHCSILPACRLISNVTLYFVYKFELRHQGDNIEHFLSFKKAGRTPKSFRAQKIWEKRYKLERKMAFCSLILLKTKSSARLSKRTSPSSRWGQWATTQTSQIFSLWPCQTV